MNDTGHHLFDSAIGRCGVAWGPAGIVAVQLPENNESRTRARLLRRCPGSPESLPPDPVRDAVARMQALLRGEPADLSTIALDLGATPDFHRRVYAVARSIPPGATMTYGDIAQALGDPGAARAVGQALGANPCPIAVPCHRVLAAGDRPGGFSANGGARTKMRMLAIEGAATGGTQSLFRDEEAKGL